MCQLPVSVKSFQESVPLVDVVLLPATNNTNKQSHKSHCKTEVQCNQLSQYTGSGPQLVSINNYTALIVVVERLQVVFTQTGQIIKDHAFHRSNFIQQELMKILTRLKQQDDISTSLF